MVKENPTSIVIISADIEWKVVRNLFQQEETSFSPYGEWLETKIECAGVFQSLIYFNGGWGKIAAAASAQYVIDRWAPDLLINLGTCGGFEGLITKGTIILVEKTIVYDILEQMVDPEASIAHYTTKLDLSWLHDEYPQEVFKTLLISGDRDLIPEEIPVLREKFNAIAGDWESGAIAYVAARNDTKCLILRGVTDIVGKSGGEAYDDVEVFVHNTQEIMFRLVGALPDWVSMFKQSNISPL